MSNNEPPASAANAPAFVYEGSELELFEHCVRWKSYFRSKLRDHLRGEVLEVGAGIGATTRCLCDGRQERWVALEPDETMAAELRTKFANDPPPSPTEVVCGTLATMDPEQKFDAIIYIDVLEHIEDDRGELERAAAHLKPGGEIVVLSPSHNWLYTDFDKAIGHYRRYDKKSLRALRPAAVEETRMIYLDAVGMLASLGNRMLLKASMPSAGQLKFWDSVLVRASTWVDPLLGYRVGKTIIAVWRLAS